MLGMNQHWRMLLAGMFATGASGLLGAGVASRPASAPVGGTSPASATTAATATAPAVDLSTPQWALISAYKALQAGEIERAEKCLAFSDGRQVELVDVALVHTYGPLKLMHAMEAKFGEGSRAFFANATLEKSLADLIALAGKTTVTINGDYAVVADKKAAVNPSAENELTGMVFRKEAEGWKVTAASFSDAAGDMPEAQLQMMRQMRDGIRSACAATAAKVAAGDFKTAEEAYADYQARLQEAMRAVASKPSRP